MDESLDTASYGATARHDRAAGSSTCSRFTTMFVCGIGLSWGIGDVVSMEMPIFAAEIPGQSLELTAMASGASIVPALLMFSGLLSAWVVWGWWPSSKPARWTLITGPSLSVALCTLLLLGWRWTWTWAGGQSTPISVFVALSISCCWGAAANGFVFPFVAGTSIELQPTL